jgi:hypothetical protein
MIMDKRGYLIKAAYLFIYHIFYYFCSPNFMVHLR